MTSVGLSLFNYHIYVCVFVCLCPRKCSCTQVYTDARGNVSQIEIKMYYWVLYTRFLQEQFGFDCTAVQSPLTIKELSQNAMLISVCVRYYQSWYHNGLYLVTIFKLTVAMILLRLQKQIIIDDIQIRSVFGIFPRCLVTLCKFIL